MHLRMRDIPVKSFQKRCNLVQDCRAQDIAVAFRSFRLLYSILSCMKVLPIIVNIIKL